RINLPVKVVLAKDTAATNTGSLPMVMAQQPPYNELYAGNYFSGDSAREALVSLNFLRSLGYEVRTKEKIAANIEVDSGLRLARADTIIGKEIILLSTSLRSTSPLAIMAGIENVIGEEATAIKIVGILKDEQFS